MSFLYTYSIYEDVLVLEGSNVQVQCKGFQIGQSNGVLLKEVAAFQRHPLIEFPLYSYSNL